MPAELRLSDPGAFDCWGNVSPPERSRPEWLLAEVKLRSKHPVIGRRKRNDRPALDKALRFCRLRNATLLVAKLDRLSRNVAFITNLRESKVKLAIADMPEIDETHLNMLAVFAQHEARAISTRTKQALAASKKALGGRRVSAERWADITIKGRSESIAVRSKAADAYASDVLQVIKEIRTKLGEEGKAASSRAKAARLNAEGIHRETIANERPWITPGLSYWC